MHRLERGVWLLEFGSQEIGQLLPLTHYLRTARGVMLKVATISDLAPEILWLALLTLVAMTVAVTRFRRTLA